MGAMPRLCSDEAKGDPPIRRGHDPAFWYTDLGRVSRPDMCRDMQWMDTTCVIPNGFVETHARIQAADRWLTTVVTRS